MKILKQFDNSLFGRKEILAEINSEISPSNLDVLKMMAENFSAAQDAVKIKKIHGLFSQKKFHIHANIYKSKEALDKFEIKPKAKKGEAAA